MVTTVVMPRLSLTMKEGTVGKWYKKEGDNVEKGEPIAEVISEKATYDLEAPAAGILRKIMVEEGVDALVNAVLAVITAPDEKLETEIAFEAPQAVKETEKVLASPAAKRLAREYEIDISIVKGSGPEGRIVEEDVRRFVEQSQMISPKVKETIPLSGFRKTSADRVSTSFRTAPHSTIMMEVNVSEATELHKKLEVSYTAIIVKAVAKALLEHPILNSTLDGSEIKLFEDVNIGIAVATNYGLVVPVIKNADKKSLKEIETSIKELSEKARGGKLTKDEVAGGTFTITNLGMYGVDFFTPIINPPEGAILGVGRITQKPIIVDGKIEAELVMILSLSYDHRVVDGAPAAEFLRNVKGKIEKTLDSEV
ncbi:MAG: 2-oxo acid dehydrogenase subunit E2 [Candidatus Bathyarchaeota archaeon]|nr:2-oxo acid dehydrogenase subunit E2 [Candidatus Bathyarchaeota archaeon]MDH5787351.1 2-oxo acid dehydrogenase subunit E2 [Candidatus Bathyarchaeota archaeon]